MVRAPRAAPVCMRHVCMRMRHSGIGPRADSRACARRVPSRSARFILAETFGVFGYAFCDFGEQFVCVDTNGEEAHSAMVEKIETLEGGETVVRVLDDTRHNLEDGDCVTFAEVGGMDELNGCEPRPVKVTGPYTFTMTGCEGMGAHTLGGIMHQVKQPKTIAFKPLREAIANPDAAGVLMSDFGKFERRRSSVIM